MKTLHGLQKLWVLTALVLAGSGVHAQTYPTKPVTVIVPQAAGGANDTVARVVAHKLSERLGQQFIVDNRAGAGGNIGADIVATEVGILHRLRRENPTKRFIAASDRAV